MKIRNKTQFGFAPWKINAVGVAMIGGAVIGAVASDRASSKAAKATEKAAERAGEAADRSAQVQWDMYEQTREDQAPWRLAGQAALNQQMALLGLQMPQIPMAETGAASAEATAPMATYGVPSGVVGAVAGRALGGGLGVPSGVVGAVAGRAGLLPGEAYDRDSMIPLTTDSVTIDGATGKIVPPGTLAEAGAPAQTPQEILAATPGYQFRMSEGLKALDRSAASRGLLGSGRQQKALIDYAGNLADTTFGDYYNRLAGISGTGQTATQATNAAGLATAGNVGQNIIQAGQAQVQAGQAQATNAIQQGNNWANLINQGAQLYAMSNFNQPAYTTQPYAGTGYTAAGESLWAF